MQPEQSKEPDDPKRPASPGQQADQRAHEPEDAADADDVRELDDRGPTEHGRGTASTGGGTTSVEEADARQEAFEDLDPDSTD
jgi:hypothetical protein